MANFFYIFYAFSFELNVFFDGSFPLSTIWLQKWDVLNTL